MIKGNIKLLPLIAMIIVSIDNIRNLPSVAIYGGQIIQLYTLVGLCFFVPCGLVTMTYAMTYSKQEGGIYLWISEAFGKKFGFFAIWLQWVENVVWFPSIVAFIAEAFAHIFYTSLDAYGLTSMVIIIFWASTWVNLRGIELTAKLSLYCTILGLIVPLVCLIMFTYYWEASGYSYYNKEVFLHMFEWHPISQLDFSVIGIMCLSLAGLEITAVHVPNIKNPQRNYTIAMLLAMLVIIISLIVGSFSILALVPIEKIDFINSIFFIFSESLTKFGYGKFEPIFALLILLGSFGGLINWIIAPIRGLMVTAKDGFLPKHFLHENQHEMPTYMLYIQAIIVTILSFLFIIFDSTNKSYWVLTIIPAGLYLLMYLLLFLAFIKLSISNQIYQFKSYLLNKLIFLAGIIGFIFSIFAVFAVLMPPARIFGNEIVIYALSVIMCIILFSLPAMYCIYYHERRSKS